MTVTIKADTTGRYGQYGILPALYNVEEAFTRSGEEANERHGFAFKPMSVSINGDRPDNFHVKDHIQSVARLSGVGQENVLVFTRSARDRGDAALYVVPFDGIASNGDAWKWADSRTSDEARDYLYYRFDGVNHAGGVQALGSMVFVANEDSSNNAYIQVLNLSKPFDLSVPKESRYINQLVIDGRNGEPVNGEGELIGDGGKVIKSKASAVAAVRLEDGRYLMFVGGAGSGESGLFYISNSSRINQSTTWKFVDFWHKDEVTQKGDPWHGWENINFISEDRTGDIYMVAMGTNKNKSFLYHLIQEGIKLDGNPNLNFEYIDGRGLDTTGVTALGVNTRNGAGIHIAPNRNLVSYVSGRKTRRVRGLRVQEFRYDDNGMNGTDGDDQILGTENNDTIYGGYGNDFLSAGNGDDLIFGGRGNDYIDGGLGNDTLWGDDGDDELHGGNGSDRLYGGNGNDRLYGDDSSTLSLFAGDDYLSGGAGNDRLYGRRGNDQLYGGYGNDILDGGEGSDLMSGGTGSDRYYVDNVGDRVIEPTNGGIDRVYATISYTLPKNVENLVLQQTAYRGIGNSLNNSITGNNNRNYLSGGAGDDTLYGLGGNDTLNGGSGNDYLSGGSGNDRLFGLTGDDRLNGGTGSDILDGGEGFDLALYVDATESVQINMTTGFKAGAATGDTFISIEGIEGSQFGDILIGDEFDNVLRGLGGNDVLEGKDGNDILEGGDGGDRLVGGNGDDILRGGDGNDDLEGGLGVDFIDGGAGSDVVRYGQETSGVTIDLIQGIAQLKAADGTPYTETLVSIERASGTAFDDVFIGDANINVFEGGDGNDILGGGAGGDRLLGGNGNDILIGNTDGDRLTGGAGADTFAFYSLNGGLDHILDFDASEGDRIQISASGFGSDLVSGVLAAEQFALGSAAVESGDRLIYDPSTRMLSFDADGSGSRSAIQLATVDLISHENILVV